MSLRKDTHDKIVTRPEWWICYVFTFVHLPASIRPSCHSLPRLATSPAPCSGARSCSSLPGPSRHMSDPDTQRWGPIQTWPGLLPARPCPGGRLMRGIYWKKARITSVMPWNRMGSWPGPLEKPKVQTALADLSSYATRRLLRPSWPMDFMNHLL